MGNTRDKREGKEGRVRIKKYALKTKMYTAGPSIEEMLVERHMRYVPEGNDVFSCRSPVPIGCTHSKSAEEALAWKPWEDDG
ncbi:hypothetical protein RRG08_063671 [Elysia crispata]|uniref:Uncharacterized protein n=1 Tax=Elysia crispata TaxID=231223 RepID=A0AAE0ZAA3_9GAST|nr:hypothetical protein RRG08_063671 [Elysia crispata]